MTSNLRYLGDTGSTSTSMIIKSATTNYNSDTTKTLKDLTNGSSTSSDCYGSYNSGTYTGNGWSNLCVHEGTDNNGNPTVWYNYSAATAGTINTKGANSTAASYDICPKNWHLPANGSSSGQIGSVTSYSSAFSPVYGGIYGNGSLQYASTRGYWWSATASSSSSNRYSLGYYSGSLSTSYSVDRYRGVYVRCVRTS